MPRLDQIKRALTYCLVISVLAAAGLGIAAVLRNQWSWFEIRVLATAGVLAAASLCGLACDLSRTPRGLNLIPYAGLGLTLVAAILSLCVVWLEGQTEPEEFVKAAGCVSVFAVATAHISLLSVARLSPRFRWTLLLAYCIIYGLASLIASLILSPGIGPSDDLFRTIAVMTILDVAITLVIPLLHRISQTDPTFAILSPQQEQNAAALDDEIKKLERRLDQLRLLRKQIAA
jgi:hypothetical protein